MNNQSDIIRRFSFAEFGKFAVVGVIGTFVDFAIYSLLTRQFHLFYIYATCISVFLAIVNNFIWNKYWTFKKGRSGQGTKETYKFFVVSIVNYFINIGITYAVVTYSHFEVIFGSYEDYFAKAVAIGIVLFSNYFGNKYWTFK
jgi:putative flippase GtrA